MKKLFFLFGLFIVILTSCSDERDFGDTPFYQMPLNQEDSLVMVKIYKAMGCESWSDKNKIDLKRRIKWPGCTFEYDKEAKEFRVTSLNFDFDEYFPEFTEQEYKISEEISNLPKLRTIFLWGEENLKIINTAVLAECTSLEYIKILYGNFTEKDINELPKLSNTLKSLTINFSGLSGSQDWIKEFPNLELLDLSNNNYEGKVPDVYKYCDYPVNLYCNNFYEMDWSYFTDSNVKRIPNLRYNKLHGEIPEDALNSSNWLAFRPYIYYQQKGYDYTNWDGR